MSSDQPLRLVSTAPSDDGLMAVVFVSEPKFMRTAVAPGFAGRALELLPGLMRHPCDNGSPHGIEAELADTEVPHLLEHIALELLALSGATRRELRGRTTWDFSRDGSGVFHVSLEGAPSCSCEQALVDGIALTAALLGRGEMSDLDECVARVRKAGATAGG